MVSFVISGDVIKDISNSLYWRVAVHSCHCYASLWWSTQIDVYAYTDWQIVRSFQLPGCHNLCIDHTLSVTEQHIKVCCSNRNILIILDHNVNVKAMHGPQIDITEYSREEVSHNEPVISMLSCPYLCQDDNEGNILVADCDNNRLLMYNAEGHVYNVTPQGILDNPKCAVYFNQRLYVGNLCRTIAMFA